MKARTMIRESLRLSVSWKLHNVRLASRAARGGPFLPALNRRRSARNAPGDEIKR